MAKRVHWYGTPSPELESRPDKNRPRERVGEVVRDGLMRQYIDVDGKPLGNVVEYAVLRVQHWHPDGKPYLIVVARTVAGWQATIEVASIGNALRYLSGLRTVTV